MSDNREHVHSPSSSASPVGRQRLAHDLRHSLFALRTGIDLLPQVREDLLDFNEVHELLRKEVATAAELANELLQAGNGSVG